ncbi:sensor histidine kinase [Oerskovia sp. NPDC056781]|uniref:sensor histidine kinase n=1 Tax=Oerskovia sp. NPDC056781 TaxID=3345942 RepID=UPI003670E5BF
MRMPARGSVTRRDVAVASFAALAGVAVAVSRSVVGTQGAPLWAELVAQLAGAAMLLWPRLTGPAVVGTALLSWVSPNPATILTAFDAGERLPPRRGAVWATAGALLILPAAPLAFGRSDVAMAAVLVLLVLGPWLAGRSRRAERVAAAALRERSAQAAEHLAAQVRTTERERLAREMHDVVAHRISYVVLQSNLLETKVGDPQVREDVERIRDTAREALEEMRAMLHLLGRDGTPVAIEQPSFRDVAVLVEEARAVGQPVEVDADVVPGEPPGLSERTAVRIVREALTNAVRHAPGAETSVSIAEEDGTLRVAVVNGPSAIPEVEMPTGGHGLQGIRERVALVRGTTTIGPTPDGGFRVEALLPRRDA